eukprot:3675101-Pleurochrysis_carterae.AAC.1
MRSEYIRMDSRRRRRRYVNNLFPTALPKTPIRVLSLLLADGSGGGIGGRCTCVGAGAFNWPVVASLGNSASTHSRPSALSGRGY